ncbi:GerMN domain-containing protein [Streptomyces sp. NBC_01260]|uniref:GerMN domain-containing protein n=1 Tax=Streptomyces sp. NBC_01260 TaxID=2903801 RepID=UPI003FCC9053
MRSERRGRRPAAAVAGAALCAILAAGCGIRTTSVPVDAGPAPSRVPCEMPAQDATAQPRQSISAEIYLICNSQLVTVDRTVQVQEAKSGSTVAAALLAELRKEPPGPERQAGFSTDVPESLRVSGPRAGDPKGALRLSEQPEDLTAEALAQIVCTYTESEPLVQDGTVMLGGPGKYAPRGYLCTAETKASPKAVPTLGAVRLS